MIQFVCVHVLFFKSHSLLISWTLYKVILFSSTIKTMWLKRTIFLASLSMSGSVVTIVIPSCFGNKCLLLHVNQSSLSFSVFFPFFFYNKENTTLKHLCLPVNRWWLFFLSLSARSWSFLALFLDSGHSLVLMFFTPCLLSGFRNTTMGYHWA